MRYCCANCWMVFGLILCQAQLAQADRLRDLQSEAERSGAADWGHWGDNPAKFNASQSHSNRLVPLYTFGMKLDAVCGENSVYRSEEALKEIYGFLPVDTLNPDAAYIDQTDVYRLQKQAFEQGKKYIFLIIFDGLDWELTRVAAQYKNGGASYSEGRGTGLAFQDYRGTETDFGFFVSSPTNDSAQYDVNKQVVLNGATGDAGGYDPKFGGAAPWSPNPDLTYLLGKSKQQPHAVSDSSCTAAAMCSGKKSYNGSINFDPLGRQMKPLAVELQEEGWKVGAVTSVPIPHATPGAAYANNVTRSDYQDITKDMVGLPSASHPQDPLPGLDVVIGTGWGMNREKDPAQGENFEPGNQYVADGTLARITDLNGGPYRVAQRTSGQNGGELLMQTAKEAAATKQRLFGFFGTTLGNLPFATADGKFDPTVQPAEVRATFAGTQKSYSLSEPYSEADIQENPTLAQMTQAALMVLSADPENKFWIMIEPGDVDWAEHSDNLDSAVGAVYSGEAAFKEVVKWIEAHDAWEDSAVFVTADHGHLFVPTKLSELKP